MISDLESRGMSLSEIAKKTKNHQSALSFIKNGQRKDLCYSSGKRLEALHSSIVFDNQSQKQNK